MALEVLVAEIVPGAADKGCVPLVRVRIEIQPVPRLWKNSRCSGLDPEAPQMKKRRTALRSLRDFVQLVERALQVFKLLPSFRELAFSGQALVIGQVSGGFCDESVEIGCGMGHGG